MLTRLSPKPTGPPQQPMVRAACWWTNGLGCMVFIQPPHMLEIGFSLRHHNKDAVLMKDLFKGHQLWDLALISESH